eukprot:TRINITY_DN3523_c0_g1_i4.p1 TRINITY_DN3523_c0_g1~~TRINITY_DN3523_c0_g1_i4.p1  ORF type:complete len:222 (-),score=53.50 TRINITY_DN3523_c0_g1_i4:9-674(-)
MSLFVDSGLFYAKPLFTGTLEKALEFDVIFETTIPALLGLPPLGRANKAEGVVIKPLSTVVYVEGKGALKRAIVKKKAEQFCEKVKSASSKQQQRFVRSSRASKASDTNSEADKYLAFEKQVEEVEEQVLCYITTARLTAVISKVGRNNSSTTGLVGLLVKDALEQCLEDDATLQPRIACIPAGPYRDRVNDTVNAAARTLVEQESRCGNGISLQRQPQSC